MLQKSVSVSGSCVDGMVHWCGRRAAPDVLDWPSFAGYSEYTHLILTHADIVLTLSTINRLSLSHPRVSGA